MGQARTITINWYKEPRNSVPFTVQINGKEVGVIKKGLTLEAAVADENISALFIPQAPKWFGWKSLYVKATVAEYTNIVLNVRAQGNNATYQDQLHVYEYGGLKTICQEHHKPGKEPVIPRSPVEDSHIPPQKESEHILDVLLALAESKLNNGQAEQAVEQYKKILELTPNVTAQYNLGSLYAQGKGVAQDFCEAAYWFKQAEKSGDEQAAKLALKCELDYINQCVSEYTYEELYHKIKDFVERIYPDEKETRLGQELSMFSAHYINDKHNYPAAAKLLKAGAILCQDGQCQNYLAVLYNAGAGVEKNDLIALYWFDQAADKGIAAAQTDRDGIINSYRKSLSSDEFKEYMRRLAVWCENGTEDIPKTPNKTFYWIYLAATATNHAKEDE